MFHVPNGPGVIVPFLWQHVTCGIICPTKSGPHLWLTFANPYWRRIFFHSSYNIVLCHDHSCEMAQYKSNDWLIDWLWDGGGSIWASKSKPHVPGLKLQQDPNGWPLRHVTPCPTSNSSRVVIFAQDLALVRNPYCYPPVPDGADNSSPAGLWSHPGNPDCTPITLLPVYERELMLHRSNKIRKEMEHWNDLAPSSPGFYLWSPWTAVGPVGLPT